MTETTDRLAELVFKALGAASMCWDPGTGDAVFASERATEIGEKLLRDIQEHFNAPEPSARAFQLQSEEERPALRRWIAERAGYLDFGTMEDVPVGVGEGISPGDLVVYQNGFHIYAPSPGGDIFDRPEPEEKAEEKPTATGWDPSDRELRLQIVSISNGWSRNPKDLEELFQWVKNGA